jgi:hypothetical protein
MDHELALPAWRPEDEGLLAALSEDGAISALWTLQAPAGAPPLPLRARSLARELAKTPAGSAVVRLAASRDAAPMARELATVPIATAEPRLVHALACYLDRLSDAYADASRAARARGDASAADHATIEASTRVRALACWARLLDEREHLVSLARRAAGDALSAVDAAAAAEDAAVRAWSLLEERARRASGSLDPDGAVALAALSRTSEACRSAGASARTSGALVARADSARAAAIGAALDTIASNLKEVRQLDDVATRATPHLETLKRVWEWSGRDVAVERFVVDELTTLGWDVYRRADWSALRTLLAPLVEPIESLESRVLGNPVEHLAYSARCAQMFVFRSEVAADWGREWDYVERALRLCPTHRNGRLNLANLCLNRALSGLDSATIFTVEREIDAAERLITRAEQLFPTARKLDEAKSRLAEAKRRVGAGARV